MFLEVGGRKAKGKRQKAKGKRQKAKGKRQKAKGKRQKAKKLLNKLRSKKLKTYLINSITLLKTLNIKSVAGITQYIGHINA
jgi:hypothetical protein